MAWLPIGYMAKNVIPCPRGWLDPAKVDDIYSVSGCLSCNQMARTLPVNRHCLFDDADQARAYLEQGVFKDCEPGPCRLLAVYRTDTR